MSKVVVGIIVKKDEIKLYLLVSSKTKTFFEKYIFLNN